MKRIEAIIRKSKFDEVKTALHSVGIDFFSFWDVSGVGKETKEIYFRGAVVNTSGIERMLLTIIVRDKNLEKTINAVMNSARTGELGDGKIFVSNVEEVYRIRTGEKGPEALFLKEFES